MPDQALHRDIANFVHEKANAQKQQPFTGNNDPFWESLRNTGTRLWLDTGDIEAADKLWNNGFSALTTNNTLLNKEIQKGRYDNTIRESVALFSSMDSRERIREIGFILNALHGLKLSRHFNASVSVELHTDVARDIEATVAYARRFHEIAPDHFIIKIPLTPEGIIATRIVREKGIPVNMTLGFSARQNYIASAVASPTYVNVFLGRINSYIVQNRLGEGTNTGERATVASQKAQQKLAAHGKQALQIAASLRNGAQVPALAGIDVFTMPPDVASQAEADYRPDVISHFSDREFPVSFFPTVEHEALRSDTLWEISENEQKLVQSLVHFPPPYCEDLLVRTNEFGCADLFPDFTTEERDVLSGDGKIPVHEKWSHRIAEGSCALDSLLNAAALSAFATDQQAMDMRIQKVIDVKANR